MPTKTIILMLILSLPLGLFAQNRGPGNLSSDLIYEKYEEAFLSRNLEQVMALYAQDAIMLTTDGSTFKGREQIESAYKGAFNYLPDSLGFETQSYVFEENFVHHVYSMWDTKSGEQLVPFSSETILLEKEKIKYHSIAQYYPEVEVPVSLKLPENWTSQTSLLPRHFAPDLYKGIVDYAFAPGMFEPKEEDYFTYAMVFWLPPDTDVSREKLQKDLETYFDGLAAEAVPGITESNAPRKIDQLFDSLATKHSVSKDKLRATVKLELIAPAPNWEKSYIGYMNIYEGLVAHQPVKLNTKLHLTHCQVSDHQVIFLEISPQPYSHRTWNHLKEMFRQWQCPKE